MDNFELFLPSFISFNVPVFLENSSHESLKKCSWCYSDSHYTHKKLLDNTLFWSWLCVIFGLNLMYVLIFLENESMFSHENLCRCSSYYSASHPTNKIFISCRPWGPFCCMFLYILKTIQYIPMKVCTDICSTTLKLTSLQFFIHIIFFSAEGYVGVFLDLFFLVYVLLFLENRVNFFSWNFLQMFLVLLWQSLQ